MSEGKPCVKATATKRDPLPIQMSVGSRSDGYIRGRSNYKLPAPSRHSPQCDSSGGAGKASDLLEFYLESFHQGLILLLLNSDAEGQRMVLRSVLCALLWLWISILCRSIALGLEDNQTATLSVIASPGQGRPIPEHMFGISFEVNRVRLFLFVPFNDSFFFLERKANFVCLDLDSS